MSKNEGHGGAGRRLREGTRIGQAISVYGEAIAIPFRDGQDMFLFRDHCTERHTGWEAKFSGKDGEKSQTPVRGLHGRKY